MLQTADDERVLLAPDDTIADFVSSTYRFDRVQLGDVSSTLDAQQLTVSTKEFEARIRLGGPAPVDRLLRLVPSPLGASPRGVGGLRPGPGRGVARWAPF